MTFVLLRILGMRLACWGPPAVILIPALGLGACTVRVQLSGPQAVQGDIAATSMGLTTYERWFEAPAMTGWPRASAAMAFADAVPASPPAGGPPEMVTLALASGLEIAAGPRRGGERLQTLLDALVINPALGPPALIPGATDAAPAGGRAAGAGRGQAARRRWRLGSSGEARDLVGRAAT